MERTDLVLAFGISGWEWLIILVVALLLFGRRLPDIMRGLGSSVKEFKKGMEDVQSTAASANPTAPSGAVSRDAAPPPAAPAAQTPPKA